MSYCDDDDSLRIDPELRELLRGLGHRLDVVVNRIDRFEERLDQTEARLGAQLAEHRTRMHTLDGTLGALLSVYREHGVEIGMLRNRLSPVPEAEPEERVVAGGGR